MAQALNVSNNRALRQQSALQSQGKDALEEGMRRHEAGDINGACASFRVALARFGEALALRSTYSADEWERARGLHGRIERNVENIRELLRDLEANALKNIDKKLAETILNEIVDNGPAVHWDDILGLAEAKQSLQEAVILPALRPDLFSGLREPARGILLFGPPGTGKTMLAKAVATESRARFFSISASSLTSKWMGESEKLVRAMFAMAAELAPSVVFIDEIDSLLSKRTDGDNEGSRRLKTEFLVQWDGVVSTNATARVLILAATNFPQSLDEAVRRRFAKRIYIPLPDHAARAQTIAHLVRTTPNSLTAADCQRIATLTDGYSGSDLKNLAKEAAMMPLRQLGMRILDANASAIRPLSRDDFEAATRTVRASVAPASLAAYEQFNQDFRA